MDGFMMSSASLSKENIFAWAIDETARLMGLGREAVGGGWGAVALAVDCTTACANHYSTVVVH